MSTHSEHDLQVAEKLGALSATAASTLSAVSELREAFANRMQPLETRVTELEAWRYRILGGAAALAYATQFIPKPF